MTRRTRTRASILSLVVTAAVVAASLGGVGGAGVVTATSHGSNSTAPTELTECRQITESGEYVLTQDLQTDGTCFRLMADEVTIDGNGHTITGTDDGATAVKVRAAADPDTFEPTDNATVTNLTTQSADIVWENGEHGTVDDVTVQNASVDLGSTSHGTVVDSHLEHGGITAAMGADNVTIRNTSLVDTEIGLGSYVTDARVVGVSGDHATVALSESENVTVRDSELREVYISGGTNLTIANNQPDDAGRFGIRIAPVGADQVTVTGNTITGNTVNASQNAGIRAHSVHNLTVTNNQISGNELGIVVHEISDRERTTTVCGESYTETIEGSVDVHRNSLANNTNGIVNHDVDTVVNAVENYWGDVSGPSSATSEPLEDPTTGTLADGDGSTVSEDPEESGVSNVRFDPWLDQSPATNTTATGG